MKSSISRIIFFTITFYSIPTQECFSPFKQTSITIQNDAPSSTNLPAGWDVSIEYIRSFPETEEALALHATNLMIAHCKKFGMLPSLHTPVTTSDIAKQWPILYIAYVDESIGMGCFTSQSIEKGRFIREYTGTISPCMQPFGFNTDYVAYLTDETLVDATTCGNESRYMNHSNNPNAERIILILPSGNTTSIIRALINIKMHEQITWDYGDNYWNVRQIQPKPN